MPHTRLTVLVAMLTLGWNASASDAGSASALCEDGTCMPNYICEGQTVNADIPDASEEGILLGPLSALESASTEDFMLSIAMEHPYSSDLKLVLSYDADRDGTPETSSTVEMYLARPFPKAEETWACSAALEGSYYFRDEGWREMGAEADFSVFAGLPTGGDWYLSAVDDTPEHQGVIKDWAVHMKGKNVDTVGLQP